MLRGFPFAVFSLTAVCAWGQNAISARSGMVNHVEGTVLLDGKAVEPKFGEFPQVNNDQTLSTEEGRAEVLLTPGALLRIAEGSSFKMLSNKLSDTALEIVSGSAMIEVDELLKDNAIAVHFKGGTVSIPKPGLYRFDADLSRFRVYDGEASVILDGRTVDAKKGKQIVFGDTLIASSFDTKVTDPFYRWASRRAEYIAAANVSAARTANNGGYSSGYSSGSGSSYGTWAFNPWYGMFTYLPGAGYGFSPFGFGYYSPYTVGYAYTPYLYGGGGAATPVLARVPSPAASSPRGTAATFNSARASVVSANAVADNSAGISPRSGGAASGSGGGVSGGGGAMSGGAMSGGGGMRGGSMGGGGSRGK